MVEGSTSTLPSKTDVKSRLSSRTLVCLLSNTIHFLLFNETMGRFLVQVIRVQVPSTTVDPIELRSDLDRTRPFPLLRGRLFLRPEGSLEAQHTVHCRIIARDSGLLVYVHCCQI